MFKRLFIPLFALAAASLFTPAEAANSATVKKLFAHPPREYATAPLWVWNDRLTEDQVRGTLRDLAGQKVRQVFVHPRPGLMTPYLSDEWFRLWRAALSEAKKLDMNVWIYDENSYPSGFAGGFVPELMPESRGRGLHFKAVKTSPKWEANTVAVFRITSGQAVDVSAKARAGEALGEGDYLVAEIRRAGNSPWHGDRCYVDLLKPGVTEKFLEVTLEAYKRELGAEFGKRIPGSFTDEPGLTPAGGLPWTDDLPQQFQARWGYSLVENLASLTQEVGDWRKVRHNYYSTLNDLFIERWAKPYYEWCARNQLEFTGHYWDHEWPHCVGVPDNMAMAAWQQAPGIDCLMNQYREDTHAQFGNVRFVRELGSIANQMGRQRTLCEIYGAGGWDLRFEDMKRIADWLGVLGVNLFDEHLSYITLRGARKRDHPQSFSYHEPWWDSYHVMAEYVTRLSCAISQGQQVNRILVIEPTTTAWMYQGNEQRLKEVGDGFFNLLLALEAAQVEYDIGCEDVIARFGRPSDAKITVDSVTKSKELVVGKRSYHTIVMPPVLENLNSKTLAVLNQVACRTFFPGYSYVDGVERSNLGPGDNRRMRQLDSAGVFRGLAKDLLESQPTSGFRINRVTGDQGILFHQRRILDDGELLFLVNTSIEHPSRGSVLTRFKGAERWDLNTGKTEPYAASGGSADASIGFDLPPSGSLLLLLTDKAVRPSVPPRDETFPVTACGPMEVRRVGPNVLTLDHVDVAAGGESRTGVYFYQANQFAFQKNGMARNPWDSAVQFKEELISRTFPAGSGFTASYRFVIEGAVPADLAIVIERPDLYTITCNGTPIQGKPGDWWLDKAFGRIAIAAQAKAGENTVTLKATPFTIYHELEPAYLLGDFALKPVASGFAVVPAQPLRLGNWNEQGLPFFAQGVAYRQRFELAKVEGRYQVCLPGWYGSVAKVRVNGKPAGHVVSAPWDCDVTRQLKRGVNEIEVEVVGTLKNTLGPHHNGSGVGSAWPGMFQKAPAVNPAPGTAYHTIGYGLSQPFVLSQSRH